MERQVGATARVTLTLEIEVGSSWGEKCTIEQVNKQAAEEAVGRINRIISNDRTSVARIVGEPLVCAILVERKR